MADGLPGADLVQEGIRDLIEEKETIASLLVSVGHPRLRRLGLDIPRPFSDPEVRLYQMLAASDEDSAHSRYNSLIRRLVSYERAAECAG